MKRQLSNTIYGLKFAMEKNDFERLKSSSGKKRNDFVANPIQYIIVESLVSYQIEYVANRCPRRQFQTFKVKIQNFKEFEIFLWKKDAFDCVGIRD